MHNYENEHILDMISDEFSWPASDRALLAILGRRDFSLRSPADQVQFNLDFEYYEELLRRTDKLLLTVFQAAFYGFSYRDIGMKKDSWRRKLQQIEKILRQEA